MSTEMQALKEEVQQLKQQYRQAEQRYRYSERRFRVLGGLALMAVAGAILVSPANRAALAQSSVTTLQQILNRLSSLETKTQFVSIGKDGEMHIVGTNLHIENGLGATNGEPSNPFDIFSPVVNGKGNLIIGYNTSRTVDPFLAFPGIDVRTGSHNLILGDENDYSSYGGMVAGDENAISGPYATISGGDRNTASAYGSSITGGNINTASGSLCSVSGGQRNTASGGVCSISGGIGNLATGDEASVSGGAGNTASGDFSSVSGGVNNTASSVQSSISGGNSINQSNLDGWSGGTFHTP